VVGDGAGAIVVCDAAAPARARGRRAARRPARDRRGGSAAARGQRPRALWGGVRAQVAALLGQLAEAMPGDRATAIRDHFLFTIVAAAARGDDVCVWAIGDGAYASGDQVRVLGPFADNQPPYLAYDLLDMPQPARSKPSTPGPARWRSRPTVSPSSGSPRSSTMPRSRTATACGGGSRSWRAAASASTGRRAGSSGLRPRCRMTRDRRAAVAAVTAAARTRPCPAQRGSTVRACNSRRRRCSAGGEAEVYDLGDGRVLNGGSHPITPLRGRAGRPGRGAGSARRATGQAARAPRQPAAEVVAPCGFALAGRRSTEVVGY